MVTGLHPVLDSPKLVATLRLARQSAAVPGTPIMIRGEPGTGAEELARFIHDCGAAATAGAFVVVKCQGVSQLTLDAELVGSPEQRAHFGPALTRATSGTLFIEEITHLSLKAQGALMSWLQAERGPDGSSPVARPSRVIAATNTDLRARVGSGAFRSDLMNELSILTLALPALRDRKADIITMARRLLAARCDALGKDVRDLSPEACEKLLDYRWPGNCRELQAVVEHALVLETGDALSASSVVLSSSAGANGQASTFADAFSRIRSEQGRTPTLAELECAYLVWLLELTHGNRTAAARLLGVSYPTIMKKILDYKIDFAAIAAHARPIL